MNRNKKGQAAPKAANNNKKNKNSSSSSISAGRTGKQVSAASAYASGQSTGKAQVYRDSVDSCRIRHRELIGSLTGSVAFTVANSFSVNPGLPASFPWLSIEAQGWEKYHFNSLKLCYYTRTGTNVPGSVLLSADYDAAESAPVNEQTMSAYYGTQEDAPWKDICFTFDPRQLAGEKFIRTGGLAANLDVKTYDVANALVGTVDGTAVSWGKLWLEYDVVLYNPQLPAGGPAGSGTLQGATSQTALAPFGTAAISLGSYNLSASGLVVSMSGLSIGAEYIYSSQFSGTGISSLGLTATTGATTITSGVGFPAAGTTGFFFVTFTATASAATFTITLAGTTITQARLVIAALTPAPGF